MGRFQVYIIKNDVNSKVYIGQTTWPLNERFNNHYNNKESNVGQAMREIGKGHFSISVLDDSSQSLNELLEKERYYIQKYDSISNGYNTTLQATNGKECSRTRFTTTLNIDIEKRLKEHSRQTSIPISKIVDKAIAMYLESVKR